MGGGGGLASCEGKGRFSVRTKQRATASGARAATLMTLAVVWTKVERCVDRTQHSKN